MNTNHLSHFLLTGLIFPRLASDARIITVSSLSHTISKQIPWDNISYDNYDGSSYSYSKLANLLFVEHLNRLILEKSSSVIAVSAHPGASKTAILSKPAPRSIMKTLFSFIENTWGQPVAHGAWPLLMAATDPEITRGCYYAPSKDSWIIREFSGPPVRNGKKGEGATDKEAAEKCWKESERITKFEFKI